MAKSSEARPLSAAGLDLLAAMRRAADAVATVYRELDRATLKSLGAPAAAPPATSLPAGPIDAAAARFAITHGLADALWDGAAALVTAAIAHDEDAAAPTFAAATQQLESGIEIVRRELPEPAPVPRTLRRAFDDAVLGAIGSLVTEAALATADAQLVLGTDDAGRKVLVALETSPLKARVALFEQLFDRLEACIADDDLLMLERMASAWQFRRWAGLRSAPRGRVNFNTVVREQEYSLVERVTMTFDAPVLAAVAADPEGGLRGAEHALAAALATSFAGVFRVVETHGETRTFEDAASRARYRVREHNPAVGYGPGYMALGRIAPFDGETWLRSPGMAFVSAEGLDAAQLAAAVERGAADLPRELLIEAMLATLLSRKPPNIPVELAPAPSSRVAEELMNALSSELEDRGLTRVVPKRSAPPEVASLARGRDRKVVEMSVDRDVAEWMDALGHQVGMRHREQGGQPRKPTTRERR